MQVIPGELTIVTGVPNSGKSEWIDALLANLAEQHDWCFALCSMEKKVGGRGGVCGCVGVCVCVGGGGGGGWVAGVWVCGWGGWGAAGLHAGACCGQHALLVLC